MAKGSRAKNLKSKDVSGKQASRVKGGSYAAATLAEPVARASQPPVVKPTFPKP